MAADVVRIDGDGLSDAEAARRLERDGPNAVPAPPEPSTVHRLARHVLEPLSAVLLAAAVVSGLVLGHRTEGLAIAAIVVLNALIATAQERRAAAALAALASMTAPMARVRRSGRTLLVPAEQLVVGDRLVVETGDRIAADATVATAHALAVDEALLTGESFPAERVSGDALLCGTTVARGNAEAEVTATGPRTTMAGLAAALAAPSQPPLVGELRRVAVWMSTLAVVLGAALVPVVLVRSQGEEQPWVAAILTGVALAVAALPEGLATVVVGALAVGAHRLAVEGAVVRELAAVEALGVVDVLCTDKTGTLTTGTLTVATTIAAAGHDERDLWAALARCIDARDGTGDPLDVAIADALPVRLRSTGERLAERPFDPAVRSMATVVAGAEGPVLVVKGAPEAVLGRCRAGAAADGIRTAAAALASEGMRVLVVASAATSDLDAGDLDVLGAVAFHDALRDTAADAVDRCHRAGIRLVMVTGDHPATARAVGRAVGIEGPTTSGPELDALGPEERDGALRRASVVARVDPFTKVALVDAHRSAGAVVAMTGDGVNDAPALRRADVGVAVAGAAGTDVAREAAQLVVTNGDLGTLVSAVGEGRRIRANLRSVVAYLLAGNLSEVLVVAAGLALLPELAVPLLPVQLLWCNLVTDGIPALALGVDRPPSDPLDRPPGARALLDRLLLGRLVARATVMASTVLATAALARGWGWSDEQVRSQLLLSLVVVHVVSAYAARARRHAFERGWWRNPVLAAAVAGSLALQLVAFGLPFGRAALDLAPLPPVAWALAAGAAAASLLGIALVQLRHGHGPEGQDRGVPILRPTA